MINEITNGVYDRYYQVNSNDIVVDIGSNIGLFSITALARNAKKLYLIEPNIHLLKTSMYNCIEYSVNNPNVHVVPINYAISSEQDNFIIHGPSCEFKTISFSNLINQYNIEHIDFLKIDCEGGKYDIFSQENINYLKNNVNHIAVEMHI